MNPLLDRHKHLFFLAAFLTATMMALTILSCGGSEADDKPSAWTAFSTVPLAPFTVTVTRDDTTGANTLCDNWSSGSGPDNCNAMVCIQAITGADPADPVGATAVAGVGPRSGRPGAVSVNLTTTRPGSWVESVGTDWSESAPGVLAAGQSMLHEDVSSPNVDNYWVQRLNGTVAAPGLVSLATTAPIDHDSNLAAIGILPVSR